MGFLTEVAIWIAVFILVIVFFFGGLAILDAAVGNA